MKPLRLGTRASVLATTQSQWVAARVTAATGRTVELVPIVSHGDRLTGSLATLGGTGVFASALRDSLLSGECDFIVHSLKDLPTAPASGLYVVAMPVRERANDALCAGAYSSIADLPVGGRVGTGSPRRAAQLLRARPDLTVCDIRGNVDSRLGRVASGEMDAVVLAEAGLRRIGREAEMSEVFDLSAVPTSAGQGALAIESREDDSPITDLLCAVDDPATWRAASLERAVLATLEAGCAAPVGISVVESEYEARLVAEVYSLDGRFTVRAERALGPQIEGSGPALFDERERMASDIVTELLNGGAADIAPNLAGGVSNE